MPVQQGTVNPSESITVEHVEKYPERDIALLFCNVKTPTILKTWMVRRVQVLTDLSSFGYPHAVTLSETGDPRYEVLFRAYKGYVIVTRGFERLPGLPLVYEISHPFPEGLSGAPLLLNFDSQARSRRSSSWAECRDLRRD